MHARKDTELTESGIFVLPGPVDLEKIRPGGRGMPLATETPTEVREADEMRDVVNSEISSRLQAVEQALKKQEEALTQGINIFTEKVVSVLVEEWQRALEEQRRYLEEQEKRCLAAMEAFLEQINAASLKSDRERQTSWLSRLFDNKNQT